MSSIGQRSGQDFRDPRGATGTIFLRISRSAAIASSLNGLRGRLSHAE